MSIFSRRNKASAEQIGNALYTGVCTDSRELYDKLSEGIKLNEVSGGSESSFTPMIETFWFCMFPLDLIICSEFNEHADSIRKAFHDRVFRHFQQIAGAEESSFLEMMGGRFAEYAEILRNGEDSSKLFQLGKLALSRISENDEIELESTLACVVRFGSTMKAFKGIGNKFKIV